MAQNVSFRSTTKGTFLSRYYLCPANEAACFRSFESMQSLQPRFFFGCMAANEKNQRDEFQKNSCSFAQEAEIG